MTNRGEPLEALEVLEWIVTEEQRFMHIQSLEAMRCMQEGIVKEADDADVGSILGWGFAPFLPCGMYINGTTGFNALIDCQNSF